MKEKSMSHAALTNLRHYKVFLLGTSALVCISLSAPVMAADFAITSGTTTNAGNTIDGNDTVTVAGALVTTGVNEGIDTTGGTNKVTVSDAGSIETAGKNAHGILNRGDGNTTAVSGNIITTGTMYMAEAWAIANIGDSNETTVSGSLKTSGMGSAGIYTDGNTNENTISGSITTTGSSAQGIYNDGNTNKTTVSGSITTTGNNSEGIANVGDDNTTTVSGSIGTTGGVAAGINNDGDRNITTVSGSIVTAGAYAHGILISGDNNTTTIAGTISATGTDSVNVVRVHSGAGNSFTFDEGAVIIGDIAAMSGATNTKLKFNLGQNASYAYSVGGGGAGTGAGQWTFTDQDGRAPIATTSGTSCAAAGVTVCNLVTAVGSGNAEAQDELQFSMNSSMIGSLEFGSNAGGSVDATSFTDVVQNKAWANLYGESSKRASSTTQASFDTSNRGLTIGTPLSISDTLDVDLVFNTSRTSLDIGLTKEQQITVYSYNFGAVVHDIAPASGWAVDAFGFVGRNSYDGKRKVMNNDTTTGSETVTAAYSGMEVLVGVDAKYSNPINDTLNFIGGLNASLSNEKIGAYSESKYFSWDARTMTQATGGFTAGLEYHTDALKTFASLGAQRSSLQNGKTAGYTNNGTAGSYTEGSGNTYRTASVGFDYTGEGGMSFSGAIERFSSTDGVSGNSASLGVSWKF